MRSTLLISIFAAALVAACSPYDPDLGDTPFRCGPPDVEPRCPDGFTCMEDEGPAGICIREGGQLPGAPDAGGNATGDSGPFACNDDSPIEPNENISQATTTPIPDTDDTYTLPALAICPNSDVDVFRLRIDTANRNITARLINTNRQAGELTLEILNQQGVPVATAQYQSDTTAEAVLMNAAVGTYYVQVRSSGGAENNYGVEIITAD